jgi:hypothetical protein
MCSSFFFGNDNELNKWKFLCHGHPAIIGEENQLLMSYDNYTARLSEKKTASRRNSNPVAEARTGNDGNGMSFRFEVKKKGKHPDFRGIQLYLEQ